MFWTFVHSCIRKYEIIIEHNMIVQTFTNIFYSLQIMTFNYLNFNSYFIRRFLLITIL